MRNGSTAGRCNSFHNFANRRGYAVHRSVVNFSTRLKKKASASGNEIRLSKIKMYTEILINLCEIR